MALGLKRQEGETWLQAALRVCNDFGGMHEEVVDEYTASVAEGNDEATAAWEALYEWDLLEAIPDEEVANGVYA